MAHGYAVFSDNAQVAYKCTDAYYPECESTLLWNDPDIGINWEIENPILSEKDKSGIALSEFNPDQLPQWDGA